MTPQPQIKGKALSIKQPWAWAIFHGKPVENRTRYSKYRGPLWIHVGAAFDYEGFYWILENENDLGIRIPLPVSPSSFPMKAIVGRVNMIDCVKKYNSPWFFGPYGFVFEDPIILGEPIPYKGQLGIFDVDIPIS